MKRVFAAIGTVSCFFFLNFSTCENGAIQPPLSIQVHAFIDTVGTKRHFIEDSLAYRYCDTIRTGDSLEFIGFAVPRDLRIEKGEWDFGDGQKSVDSIVTHAYRESGIFRVTYSVFDRLGNALSDTVVCCVNTPPQWVRIVSPAEGAGNQPLTPRLAWKGYDKDDFDTSLVYSVVVLPENGRVDTVMHWDTSTATYLDVGLDKGQKVAWYVQARDRFGEIVTSDTAYFTIRASEDATLARLVPSAGKLVPLFSPSDTLYCDTVPYTQSDLAITAVPSDRHATVSINAKTLGASDSSVTVPLQTGTSLALIAVSAPDGATKKTYSISITRRPEPDCRLSLVILSHGTLKQKPAPVPDTLRDTVSFMDSSLVVTPFAADTLATVTINAVTVKSGAPSASLPLSVGENEAIVNVVSSQENRSKSYILLIIRKPNSTEPLKSPPAGLAVKPVSPTSMSVSWNDLFGANFYTVERSRDAGDRFTKIGTSNSNSFLDTLLDSGSTYHYRVSASNSVSTSDFCVSASGTTLLKPSFLKQPENQTTIEGGKAVFSVTARGIPAVTYQWRKNGANMAQAVFASCTTASLRPADNGAEYSCVIANTAGSDTSIKATVSVDSFFTKPFIKNQPRDTALVIGSRITFIVEDTGSYLKVQWRKDTQILTPATCTLSLQGVSIADAGIYSVKVYNRLDSAVSRAFQLRVLPSKPTGLIAAARSIASVGLSWNKADGATRYLLMRSNTSGAFSAVCTTAQINAVDTPLVEGTSYAYRIIAANADGESDTGGVTTATTWKRPVIVAPPKPDSVMAGDSIVLSVEASGNPACTYQWKKGGSDIPGATSSTYRVAQATKNDSGDYAVTVKNSAGTVTSAAVHIWVLLPTFTLTLQAPPATVGTVRKTQDLPVYQVGDSVRLTAHANAGYRFTGWSGDTTGTDTSLLVVMRKNRSISANFIRRFTLTISASAHGTVSPAGTVTVDSGAGTLTTISSTSQSGYVLRAWRALTGQAVFGDSTAASTTVKVINGDVGVQAVFKINTFVKTFGGTDNDWGYCVQQTSDSGYVVSGYTESFGAGGRDMYLVKTGADGNSPWQKYFGTTANEGGSCVQQLGDGGYVIAGTTVSLTGQNADIYLVKTGPMGNASFTRTIHGPLDHYQYYMEKATGGGYVFTGFSIGSAADTNIYFVKTNDTGGIVNTPVNYPGPNADFARCIRQISGSSGYYIAGATSSFGAGGQDAYLIRTDDTGGIVWSKTYGGADNEFWNSIQPTSDGGCAAVGFIAAGSDTSVYCAKIDASGNATWTKTYSGTGVEYGRCIQQTSDGGYIIAGGTTSTGHGAMDVYLIKINAAGDTLWTKTYGGALNDFAFSVTQTFDGGYIVTGHTKSLGAGGEDVYLIKTDDQGDVK